LYCSLVPFFACPLLPNSYLRIRSLVPMLEPKSILALTATAGPMVIKDICHTLGIPRSNVSGIDNDGVRVLDCKRDNIDVATLVMEEEDSRRSLVSTNNIATLAFFFPKRLRRITHPIFSTPRTKSGFLNFTALQDPQGQEAAGPER